MSNPINPITEFLMNLLGAWLAPFFLTPGITADQAAALAAATLEAYNPRDPADLLAAAQIAALTFATIDSVARSMDPATPLPMLVRLRANANALTRTTDRLRHARDNDQPPPQIQPMEPHDHAALARDIAETQRQANAAVAAIHPQPETQPPQPQPPQPQPPQPQHAQPQHAQPQKAEPKTAPAPTHHHVAPDTDTRALWAQAFSTVAAEYGHEAASLPPGQASQAASRANLLRTTAQDLLAGTPIPSLFNLPPLSR